MFNKACDFLLIIVISLIVMTYGDTFIECEGKDQMYAELQEDCSFYIFCHGDESFSDACPEESPYFSVEEQTCETDKSVCKDRPILNEDSNVTTEEEEDISTESPFSESTSAVTITVSTVTSPATTSVQINTTTSAIFPTMPTIFPAPVVPSICPVVDNPNKAIFLPHAKSCSEYFLCFQGERLPMRCSNLLHFDVRQQKCDYAENVKCHMMDVVSPREQCLSHTFDFYPHPNNCNYYYQCIFGYLKVMQCPLNMGWHYEKRVCVMRAQAKCYNSFARKFN